MIPRGQNIKGKDSLMPSHLHSWRQSTKCEDDVNTHHCTKSESHLMYTHAIQIFTSDANLHSTPKTEGARICYRMYKFMQAIRTQSGYSLKHGVSIHTCCNYMTVMQYSINVSNKEQMYLTKNYSQIQCHIRQCN